MGQLKAKGMVVTGPLTRTLGRLRLGFSILRTGYYGLPAFIWPPGAFKCLTQLGLG